MKQHLLLALFFLARCALAQETRSIDAHLLDARYEDVLKVADVMLASTTDPGAMASLNNKKAEALIRLGKLDQAALILQEAERESAESKSLFHAAITQSNYGLLYLNLGRNDLAQDALNTALGDFERSGKSETLEAANALAHLGNLYRATGKYSQAEEQLNRSLSIRLKLLKPNSEYIAASYNDLGLIFGMTNPDKALDYYEKALAIYKELHPGDHPKIAIANTNVGFIYSSLELYGDAVNNFESALKIWEKVYHQPHGTKAFVLFNLGQTYMKMQDHKAARGYYERALKTYTESYGKKHPDIARVLNAIGDLDVAERRYDAALGTYQQALSANVSRFNEVAIAANPASKDFYDGNVLLFTLVSKAEALESRHVNKTLKFQDLTLALHTLQICDTLIDKLRQQITNESDKIMLGNIASEVYANGVRIAYETAQVALRKKGYLALSFYFAEKSKSAVLLEAISDANAKSFAGIPDDLLEEENTLKSAIAHCSQQLAQKPSPEEENYLRETSFNLNRQFEAFTKKLEKEFPEYFNLKFNATAPSIPELQSRLDDETELISYSIDEKNKRLYIFQINRKTFTVEERGLPQEFDRYITGLRNSLFFNEMKTYTKAASSLAAVLLPSRIPASIHDLIILPVGRLGTLPFETLLKGKFDENTTYSDLPYLLNSYSIRYEFSAGLILQKKQGKPISSNPAIFLCAPVTFPEKDALVELPGSEAEVKDIASLFSSKNLNSGLFTREQADEKRIKSGDLKKYNYLHFATHGVVDESSPELSRIFLQTDTGAEDGNLFAGEIYNLDLDATLVTLSACQTGLGKISKGEGVIGLSRALVYAGAQSIVVSFWSVADQSTAALMKDFYNEMLQSPKTGFSDDLRQAKLNLIRGKQYAAPYYWAPFILIGF